jgi:hypothetical protein
MKLLFLALVVSPVLKLLVVLFLLDNVVLPSVTLSLDNVNLLLDAQILNLSVIMLIVFLDLAFRPFLA